MPRKKLQHYQILRIEEVTKGSPVAVALRQFAFDELRTIEAPDGSFTRYMDTVILPKRKRGTKFRATYTQIFQKEL